MASIDKFASSHRLKTYGKAPRNQTFTSAPRLQRPTTQNQPRDGFVSHRNGSEAADESGVHKQQHRVDAATKPKPLSARKAPVPVKTYDASVFDVPSSGDEQHATSAEQQRRKRRKLSMPSMPMRTKRKEFDDAVSEQHLARKASPLRSSSRRDNNSNAKTSRKRTSDSSEVEVVVRTPRKAKKMWDSMPTAQDAQSTQKRAPPKRSGAVSRPTENASTQESSTGVDDATWSLHGRHVPLATKRRQSTPTSVKSSPADKLRRMTEHLTSPPKPAGTHDRNSGNAPFTIGSHPARRFAGSTPDTPSRTRLVDALGGSRREDRSSDSGASSDSSFPSTSRRGDRQSISPPPSESSFHTALSQRPASSQVSSMAEHHKPNPTQESQSHHRRAPATSQKVTYARQRSFLTEADMINGKDGVDPLNQMASSSFSSEYGSGAKPDKRPPFSKNKSSLSFDIDDDDDDDGNNSKGGAVRSIYELRRAGSNARHQGFMETMFDDLEDKTSLSCKRASLIQLCSKLSDYQFAQRFLGRSLDQRLAKCTGNLSTDLVCGFLLTCIYASLLSTTPAAPIVLRTCSTQMSKIAPVLLSERRGIMEIAKQRDTKMTKDGLNRLRDVVARVQAGKIWAEQRPKTLSPQVLALRCTELTIRRIRETGDAAEPITTPVLRQLVDLLLQQSSAPEVKDAAETDDLLVLELAFSILESYTVGLGPLEPGQEAVLRGLARLGPLLAELTRQSGPLSRQIQGLEIRLILNITNNNSRLCDDFSTPELVQALANIVLANFGSVADELAGSEKKESLLDTVILALGALINLAEWSGTARRLILESSSQADTNNGTTLLDGLIEGFLEGWEAAAEAQSVVQTHSNVVFGYLSVLLGTLALEEEVRTRVRAALPGRTLDRLLSTMEEFLHYHRKVEEEIRDARRQQEEEDDAMAGFTTRLQSIVDRIRAAEGRR